MKKIIFALLIIGILASGIAVAGIVSMSVVDDNSDKYDVLKKSEDGKDEYTFRITDKDGVQAKDLIHDFIEIKAREDAK